MITVWTDGSCIPNPGNGGWAWITKDMVWGSGKEEKSTNQRMEMRAVIEAIMDAGPVETPILIITDSQFVIKGATEWVHKWIDNNWITSSGTLVKNRDLWEELYILMQTREVRFRWVKGHNGDEMNERVDELANKATGIPREYWGRY